jgi:NADH dehydrogenase FAD-containing subunit
MNKLSRRGFLKSLGIATTLASFPSIVSAVNTAPRVVVIGGGFAGTTAAKYLKHWAPHLNVTLIAPNANYYAPILSNLVMNGQMSLKKITFNYNATKQKYGVDVIHDWVKGIDSAANRVILKSGAIVDYDRLIVAPGISFETINGLNSDTIPHAWTSGEQIVRLQGEIKSIPQGGTFVMTIPPAPYRCPPAPYERACLVADYLQRKRKNAKVIVLDANADILAEKEAFSHAFKTTYANTIEYHTNVVLESVDSKRRIAVTSQGDFQADVLNVIPTQSAGKIILSSGLANDSSNRWAEVNPLSYESTAQSNIHVIGDSQATGQPKAGHIANAEAKVCADAVIRLLAGGLPYQSPMTNSACYSPISSNTASWATVVYQYDPSTQRMIPVSGSGGAATRATKRSYRDMFDWSDNLFADTFS